MATNTEFDAAAVRTSARIIGDIMNDMAAFDQLKAHWPTCGTFSTAQWLERIVDDRRNAIVAHAERLKVILGDLNTGLTLVATDLEDTDEDNAAQIGKRLETLRTKAESDIAALDTGTEGDQHNFTADKDAPSGNESDGDGYNDVLPGPTTT